MAAAGGGDGFFLPGDDVGLGWYNVATYGATGNGSTDDTSAIQAAIDAAPERGTVYFPPGTYRITSALAVSKGLLLRGAGYPIGLETDHSGGSVIVQATANTDGITCSQSPNADVSNTTWIEGLRITAHGAGTQTSGNGVYGLTDVNLTNCQVDGFWNNVYLDDHSWSAKITNVTLASATNANLYLNVTNYTQCRSLITEGGPYGVYMKNCLTPSFQGCLFEFATVADVWYDGAASGNKLYGTATFSGCWFESVDAVDNVRIGANYPTGGLLIEGAFMVGMSGTGTGRTHVRTAAGCGPMTLIGCYLNHGTEQYAILGATSTSGPFVLLNNDVNGGTISLGSNSYSHLP
jgi:hypothetical protein